VAIGQNGGRAEIETYPAAGGKQHHCFKKLGRAYPLVKQSTEILKNCKPDPLGILKTSGKACFSDKADFLKELLKKSYHFSASAWLYFQLGFLAALTS
jgi:hypothetical protein